MFNRLAHSLGLPKTSLVILGALWFGLAAGLLFLQLATPLAITLEWETETEFNTAGFNVLRSDNQTDSFVKINERLIPSNADPASGASYSYIDKNIEPGKTYFYRLEDVELDSTSVRHEILTAQAPTRPFWLIILALISGLAGLTLLISGLKMSDGEKI